MAQGIINMYVAPITLGFTPSDGDIIEGTINGVNVGGEWLSGRADLKNDSGIKICDIRLSGDRAVVTVYQDSAPTTDYELHLYRYVPAGIVQIPQRYVDGLEETTANANQALETATAAQSTATAAQSTADAAKSTADTAKSTADTAKSTADTAKSTADTAKSTADTAVKPSKQGENICWYWMENPYSQYSTVDTLIGSTGGTALEIIVNEKYPSVAFVPPAYGAKQADFEFRRCGPAYPHPLITGIGGIVVYSSTPNSTKKFKITVDDTGTISATEVT